MPSAADGSTTRPAWSRSIRIPAMIDASWTRTASSATRRRSSRTAGMGRWPAAVSDGAGRVGGDDAPLAPGVCHRRCAQRLDADHLDVGRPGTSPWIVVHNYACRSDRSWFEVGLPDQWHSRDPFAFRASLLNL